MILGLAGADNRVARAMGAFAYTAGATTGTRMRRTVFYISDGTGITAETIGHSVLPQCGALDFDTHRIPFVNDEEQAHGAVAKIRNAQASTGTRAIVINTVVEPASTINAGPVMVKPAASPARSNTGVACAVPAMNTLAAMRATSSDVGVDPSGKVAAARPDSTSSVGRSRRCST